MILDFTLQVLTSPLPPHNRSYEHRGSAEARTLSRLGLNQSAEAIDTSKLLTVTLFVMSSSAALTVMKDLVGSEGGSITLPDPVGQLGFLSYGIHTIAEVDEMKFKIVEKRFNDRLFWNDKTWLFEIKGLKTNDSGEYFIDSKKGNCFFRSYKLTVYESVPTPAVNTVNVSTDSCILLCSVDKAETTLLWYKDEEILNQSSSALSLPLTVHKQDFSSSYRCEASNPAEHKTLHVDITTSCSEQNNRNSTDNRDDTMEGSSHKEMKNLTGTVGGSITLPDCTMQSGYLKFGVETVAKVNKTAMKNETYKENIHWNSAACFTLTHLQMNDSGIYYIDSKEPPFIQPYNLTVYESPPGNNSTRITLVIVTIIVGLIIIFCLYI
ncbi:CD48 antigen-like isoform X3 [Scomber scombrus]|uniref:CD48 antigen-like isoform X3 n=1 Tax=Scomber scombrus TaxID=13677 RepID=A0AAV1PF45_SCOSC